MCSLIGCVLVQTSYGIALAFTSWSSDYFQSSSPSWARSTYCRCLLGNQSFQSGCRFPGPDCWKDLRWTSMHTCAIVLSTYFQVGWKCLPSQVALIVFNILQTNSLCSLFLRTFTYDNIKHEQLCKIVSFWKKLQLCVVSFIYMLSFDQVIFMLMSVRIIKCCFSVCQWVMAFVLSLMQGSHTSERL